MHLAKNKIIYYLVIDGNSTVQHLSPQLLSTFHSPYLTIPHNANAPKTNTTAPTPTITSRAGRLSTSE